VWWVRGVVLPGGAVEPVVPVYKGLCKIESNYVV
jgi:hypothetical protein